MNFKYITLLLPAIALTGCLEQYDPAQTYVSKDQVQNAPNSAEAIVAAVTSDAVGHCCYASYTYNYAWDFGLPAQFIARDVEGQDMTGINSGYNWFSSWEYCDVSLSPGYALCQVPWTVYYSWIKNCNSVLTVTTDDPDEGNAAYAGIAHAMRAYYYMDLAQMFAPQTYLVNPDALTVPIITQNTTKEQAANNPRATNREMWDGFIMKDLDRAERELKGYTRSDKTVPDLSVVYGLKARAYLIMGNWAEAEKYAKMAQTGYTPMTVEQFNDRTTGFNTPNQAWMLCMQYRDDDRNITWNDGDASWGTWMITELTEACGMGYASNYGYPFHIDRHLFETIPATDGRKDAWIDFKVWEDLEAAYAENEYAEGDTDAVKAAKDEAVAAAEEAALEYVREHNSDYPENMVFKPVDGYDWGFAGISVKFRPAGGNAGYNNQNIGYVVAVPMMRVEEMMLIEAEAAGMQSEGRGRQLLEAFGKLRDPNYVYGQHQETYNSDFATAFQNEVWWQRRVELWGEGFSTFDIKRLNKGIIRSYPNTNHMPLGRWNTNTPPSWMTWCIIGTEANYNSALAGKNNPIPVRPTVDSPEHIF